MPERLGVSDIPQDDKGQEVIDALDMLARNYAEAREPQNTALRKQIRIYCRILEITGVNLGFNERGCEPGFMAEKDLSIPRSNKSIQQISNALAISLATDFASQARQLGMADLLIPVPENTTNINIVDVEGNKFIGVCSFSNNNLNLRGATMYVAKELRDDVKGYASTLLERYASSFGELHEDATLAPIDRRKIVFPR